LTTEKVSKKTDWSSLWKKEDWWAVWIGLLILLLGVAKWLPSLPKITKWATVAKSFPAGLGTIWPTLLLFIFLLVLTLVAIALIGKGVRRFFPAFIVIFSLAFLAAWVGKYTLFLNWGLETVLWALVLGLAVGNIWRIPEWLKAGIQTEFFIKIGLVLLGAEILFSTIAKGGAVGIGQALLVVTAVWFAAYWIARKFGLEKNFASVMATGLSICGVSAAIAAGGAIKGNPKHTSHVISLVLLVAMPMLVGMPLLVKALGLSPQVGGAWIGSTVDTTAATVAAATMVDPQIGLQVGSLVKISQNVLIGFAAFFLAIWSTFSGQRKSDIRPDVERPRLVEIWYRFPKFIIGFVVASFIFSLVVEPAVGTTGTNAILGLTKGYREWFFTLAFISIGLETRFKELVAVGGGRPVLAFVTSQVVNILWALLIVWILWSGTFFAPPIR